jgi:hypothetical protein
MESHLAKAVGVGAAAASLYAAQSKTIIPLRAAVRGVARMQINRELAQPGVPS